MRQMQFKLRLSVGLIARVTLLDLGLTVVGEVAPESKGTDSPILSIGTSRPHFGQA